MTGHTLASSNDPSSFEDVYDSAGMSMTCFGSINNVKTEMLLNTGSVFSIINYDLYKTINQRSVSVSVRQFRLLFQGLYQQITKVSKYLEVLR